MISRCIVSFCTQCAVSKSCLRSILIQEVHLCPPVDYFSNFLEVGKLPPGEIKSEDVIKHTKSIFALHGIPEILISHNGPQWHYSSNEYKHFAKVWEFFHDTSSPKYPKGNVLAEARVKVIEKLLKKASSNDEDSHLTVLAHSTTPGNDGRSPAEN